MSIQMPTYCCPNAVIYMTCPHCGKKLCNRCVQRSDAGNFLCPDCAKSAGLPQPDDNIRRVS